MTTSADAARARDLHGLGQKADTDRIAPIEALPTWALCVPFVAQWLWLGLRHGDATLPSAINPKLETGGLAGESKFACLAHIPDAFRDWVALTGRVPPDRSPEAVRRELGLAFPLVAKPDIGCSGYGVRRIADEAELKAYRAQCPAGATVLLQRLIEGPGEAGLQYIRRPSETCGRVTALTLRHHPFVVGDGRTSVRKLAAIGARTRRTLAHAGMDEALLSRVPAVGERVMLTTVGSLRVGARYESAPHLISPRLEAIVDDIARAMGDFHYGRFDVRFTSNGALRAGRFVIIEVNGAGAEAIQYWDPRVSLAEAFKGVFAKQRALFELAAEMRARGHRPVGARGLATSYFKQRRLVRAYPASN